MQMRIVNFFFRRELFRRGVVSSRHSESKWTSAANRHVTMTRRSSHLLLPSTLGADRHPSNIQQRSGACIYRWTRPFECGASFVDDLVHTRFALFVFKNKTPFISSKLFPGIGERLVNLCHVYSLLDNIITLHKSRYINQQPDHFTHNLSLIHI